MAKALEKPFDAPTPAQPEHPWRDAIEEAWHAGLRMVRPEAKPTPSEPQHVDFKELVLKNERDAALNMDCIFRRPLNFYSKALKPEHLDMSNDDVSKCLERNKN